MSIRTLLNRVREQTGSVSFAESKLGDISGYVSTGSYALNRIISGSCFKGVPNGRVITINGESVSGKSFIAAEITANAMNQSKYDLVFWLDSEGGALKQFFVDRGVDISKIEHVPIEFVEDATIKLLSIYAALKEERKSNADFKALIVFDSLGALVPSKLINDATNKGKQAQDMGLRAKLCNNLVKACIMQALISDVSVIFINHVYSDTGNMFPSKIKNQSGGLGIQYASTITIQCDKCVQKNEDRDKGKTDIFYDGSFLKFFTTKNRIIKPFYETEFFIDFNKGYNKFDGLVEPALKYKFITEGKNGYFIVPSWNPEEQIKKTKILDEKYIPAWESFIKEFDEKSQKEMCYGSLSEIEKMNVQVPEDSEESAVVASAEDITNQMEKIHDEVISKKKGKK